MASPERDNLTERIGRALPALVELRHDLHAHPQLAFEETYAAQAVQRRLTELDIPFEAEVAQTGVVGRIMPTDASAARRPAVALRADMDALPITEQTDLPYASQHAGCMHACGHDGHTTILLGAAEVLTQLRDRLPRPVKLLFQPAEELGGGARHMIKAGALDERIGGVAADRVFGLHGWPSLALGQTATRPGPVMASTDLFWITVHGRGGHGAAPHTTADPILAAAHVITALQSIVSRNVDPTLAAVVTVGSVQAGTTENVIPDTARLAGTVRTFDDALAKLIHARIEQVATQVAGALGCRAEVKIEVGYPATINDPDATAHVQQAARATVGETNALTWHRPSMVAEDFAYYGREVPAAFFFLGLKPTDAATYPGLHTAKFDFNDAALPTGIRMMCTLALQSDAAPAP